MDNVRPGRFRPVCRGGKSVLTINTSDVAECGQIVDILYTARPAEASVLGPQNDMYPRIVTTDGKKELVFTLYTGGFTVSGSAAEGKNPAPAYTCGGYAGLGALFGTLLEKCGLTAAELGRFELDTVKNAGKTGTVDATVFLSGKGNAAERALEPECTTRMIENLRSFNVTFTGTEGSADFERGRADADAGYMRIEYNGGSMQVLYKKDTVQILPGGADTADCYVISTDIASWSKFETQLDKYYDPAYSCTPATD